MDFVKPLKGISKKDTTAAGGKGASLGEMTQAGIPVPPGFVVLTSAFEQFIKEADIIQEINAQFDKLDHREMEQVAIASEVLQKRIENASMPEDIGKSILAEFGKLRATHVAVRSSATAEDSSEASWAGELDTFLHISKANLLEHAKKCWASLFTPRAIFYRLEKKLHKSKVSVAVVVQKMVESDVAGVAFSVHPVTQDKHQMIIEAGWGLGESVVSGQITPDSYVVDKQDWALIDVNVSDQEKGIFRKGASGTDWKLIPKDKREKQKLTGRQIITLAKLVKKIEEHYGFPVDVEWALEGKKLFITQSRPITTLT